MTHIGFPGIEAPIARQGNQEENRERRGGERGEKRKRKEHHTRHEEKKGNGEERALGREMKQGGVGAVARGKMRYPHSYLVMLKRYLEETGRRCVSYVGLRKWIYGSGKYADLEWHTVERALRKLAEHGYLERVELSGRRVVFCMTGKAYAVLARLGSE